MRSKFTVPKVFLKISLVLKCFLFDAALHHHSRDFALFNKIQKDFFREKKQTSCIVDFLSNISIAHDMFKLYIFINNIFWGFESNKNF